MSRSEREGADNEYLSQARNFLRADRGHNDPNFKFDKAKFEIQLDRELEGYRRRPDLVARFAWALPNDRALQTLAEHAPLIEIGAGTGYWAHLLRKRGVAIRAYDHLPPHRSPNVYHPDQKVWTTVYRGGPEKAANYSSRTLFLCWPPYKTRMALDALTRYRGETVIYVGEGEGGCTGCDKFHEKLDRHWKRTKTVDLPQWPGIHDSLTVWNRVRT